MLVARLASLGHKKGIPPPSPSILYTPHGPLRLPWWHGVFFLKKGREGQLPGGAAGIRAAESPPAQGAGRQALGEDDPEADQALRQLRSGGLHEAAGRF